MFRKRLYSITSSSPLCKGKTSSLRTTQAISSDTSSSHNEEFSNFPKSAKVVICGSGVQGAAVAYHLAKMGWGKETVVLDQGKIGNVTSWLSSGLIGMFKPSRPETKLAQYSIKMYKEMEAAGLETGWKQCGSLLLARTIDRMTMLKKMKALSRARDIDCDVITPEEAQKLCPLIAIDDLKGGLWIPGDGIGDPYKLCLSLASAAEKEGVTLIENCAVQRIINEGGKVVAVDTSKGLIECDYFVNCGGFWARKIGQMSEPFVKVPLHPCEHYYLHTKTIPGLDPMTPAMQIHISQETKQYLDKIGGYIVERRGSMEVKGKGNMETYWLMGKEFVGDVNENGERYSPADDKLNNFKENVPEFLKIITEGSIDIDVE